MLVPADRFRFVELGPVESVELQISLDGVSVEIDVSSDIVDSDHFALLHGQFDTTIDLAGAATVLHNTGGDLVIGDSFVLFVADKVVGAEDSVFTYPAGTTQSEWLNTIEQSVGNRVVFSHGEPICVCGVNDGDGVLPRTTCSSRVRTKPGCHTRCP